MILILRQPWLNDVSGLAQEYSHAHVVMVIIGMLKILCRMRLPILMVMIMLRGMTMHMLRGGADENDDVEEMVYNWL